MNNAELDQNPNNSLRRDRESEEVMEERIIKEFLEYQKTKVQERTKRKARWPKVLMLILLFLFGITLLAFLGSDSFKELIYGPNSTRYTYTDTFADSRKAHFEELEHLRKIENEILEDIKEGRYDNAMIKAQTLYYTTGYSNDTEKAWNEKREALIKELQKHTKDD